MKVISVPRYFAEDFTEDTRKRFISDYDMSNTVWVSIQEEGRGPTSNPILDKLPNIKLDFADLYEPQSYHIFGQGVETFNPPTKKDAKQIVNFLMKHKGMNVIVNCAAGVSRSGAVAKFCEECLGYEWNAFAKSNSDIKNHLFDMMVDYFNKKYKNNSNETVENIKTKLDQ